MQIGPTFVIIWEMFHGRISLNYAAGELCKWIRVGIDVYIPHRRYQVMSHSSPCFLAAYTVVIVYGNYFFHLYQPNKSSKSKAKFRWASNCCKRVLEAAKLAYANKKRVYHFPFSALGTFGKLLIAFSTKVNLLYFLYSTAQRCFLLHLIKQNCLPKPFLRTLILMSQVSLKLFSLLELIWN